MPVNAGACGGVKMEPPAAWLSRGFRSFSGLARVRHRLVCARVDGGAGPGPARSSCPQQLGELPRVVPNWGMSRFKFAQHRTEIRS